VPVFPGCHSVATTAMTTAGDIEPTAGELQTITKIIFFVEYFCE
jgi:hypothetical protein